MKHLLLFILLASSINIFSTELLFNESLEKPSTEEISANININYLNGKLSIENAPMNSSVEIFSMLGVSVFHDLIFESKQYFLIDLKKGYYIVKIAGITKKISVK